MLCKRSARQTGFTLVETLAAGIILAISAVAISQGVSLAMHLGVDARETRRAAAMLDSLMTKIDLIGPQRLLYEGPTEGVLDQRFTWRATIDEQLDGYLYKVTVQIHWSTPRGQRRVMGYTLLNDAPGARNALLAWDDLQ